MGIFVGALVCVNVGDGIEVYVEGGIGDEVGVSLGKASICSIRVGIEVGRKPKSENIKVEAVHTRHVVIMPHPPSKNACQNLNFFPILTSKLQASADRKVAVSENALLAGSYLKNSLFSRNKSRT